ncbi:MAG: type 4a pilus biogenesis protein PilO [Candidatus Omnitrophica bacterium]|nr:type 4a pilus biogenesis protein PilO [Candidatus Omnitrophota bacterium]
MSELDRNLVKMKAMDPKVLYVLFGVGIVVLLVIDFFVLLSPQISGLMAQNKKNTELQAQIGKLQEDKQHISQFQKGLADMKTKAADFDRMVYSKDDVPVALKNISTLANEYGVKIDQLVPQRQSEEQLVKNEEGVYKSMAIFVGARSGYHEFGRFLNGMEKGNMFWRLDELVFSADDMNPQKHIIKMVIRILVLEK